DEHLLADARRVDRAPAFPRPDRRHAHPAGALVVLRALAVPEELHLHATILVRVDLVARGTDDDSRLISVRPRQRCRPLRTIGRIEGRRREAALVREAGIATGAEVPQLRRLLHTRHEVRGVGVLVVMLRQLDLATHFDRATAPASLRLHRLGENLLMANA